MATIEQPRLLKSNDILLDPRGGRTTKIVYDNTETHVLEGVKPRAFLPVAAQTARTFAKAINAITKSKAILHWNTTMDFNVAGADRIWPLTDMETIDIVHAYNLDLPVEDTSFQPEVDVLIHRVSPRANYLGVAFRYQLSSEFAEDEDENAGKVTVQLISPDTPEEATVYDGGFVFDPATHLSVTDSEFFEAFKNEGFGIQWAFGVGRFHWLGIGESLPMDPPRALNVSQIARAATPLVVRFTNNSVYTRIISAHVFELPETDEADDVFVPIIVAPEE